MIQLTDSELQLSIRREASVMKRLDSLSTSAGNSDPNSKKNEINNGKWTKEEHRNFLNACMIYGNNWFLVQKVLKNRTSAQIRSHAQKYVIKVCRKYNIKIHSKKFNNKLSKHLEVINNSNKPRSRKCINIFEKRILDIFNYYKREYKPFFVEKSHKNHTGENCVRCLINSQIERRLKYRVFNIEKRSSKTLTNTAQESNLHHLNESAMTNYNVFYSASMMQGLYNSCIYSNLSSLCENLATLKQNLDFIMGYLDWNQSVLLSFCNQIGFGGL